MEHLLFMWIELRIVIWHIFGGDWRQNEKLSEVKPPLTNYVYKICNEIFVLYSSESGFVCMEASRKSDSILSLRLGKLSRNPEEACNQHLFFDASIQPVIIVSSKHGQRERCPLVGKYALIGKTLENNNNNEKSSCAIDQQHLGTHQHLDHVTFGCAAGGATEFNVVQNNCNVSSTTANRITETSSKHPKIFYLLCTFFRLRFRA